MHTASDFAAPTPPANPVAQRDATLAMLEDIRRRLDNADTALARIEAAAHGKDKAPRAILHPADRAAPRGYSSCGRPVEVTVGDLTAEVMVYLYTRHESDAAPCRPVLVVVGQAWTDDAGPVMNTAEWAVYATSHPGLAEALYEAAVDKWAGYAEQAHERALEAR